MAMISGGFGSGTRFIRYTVSGSSFSTVARVGTKIGCTSRTAMAASSVPAKWTDVVVDDPFVVIAAGRALFRADDLVEIVALVQAARR